MVLRVTANFAHRLGTIAPIHTSCCGNKGVVISLPVGFPGSLLRPVASSLLQCNAKCSVFASVAPARTAWNCGRFLSRCMQIRTCDGDKLSLEPEPKNLSKTV